MIQNNPEYNQKIQNKLRYERGNTAAAKGAQLRQTTKTMKILQN